MKKKNDTNSKQNHGFLNWIEKVGNKVPHPFILFLWLIVILSCVSFVVSKMNITAIDPSTGESIIVKNVFSGEGLEYLLLNMVPNFAGFAPLGMVLVLTFGIGVAEEVGLISAFMRKTILGASPKLVTFMIMLIGILGNIASGAASIVVPGIAAMLFLSVGRNPLVGVATGFAATSAGFTANLLITGTDSLLTGITNEAVASTSLPQIPVTSNWYFMFASTWILALTGTFVAEKIVEPRMGKYQGELAIEQNEVTAEENKALKAARNGMLTYFLIMFILAFPQNSVLRNPDTGSLIVNSVLFKGIVPLIFIFFLATAIPFGVSIGKIKNSGDVPRYMSKAIKGMSSFLVSTFIIAQFIALFNWTNLGVLLAVNGAHLLESTGFVGIPLFVSFILLTAFINLFIGSGSAKWGILAPIFVPMLGLLGLNPAFTQIIYRIGDSSTNIITPMRSAIPILLGYLNKYDENAGVGTLFSMTIPFSMAFLLVWIVQLIVWYVFDIPLGPGINMYL